jgi:hypothetical protein
MQSNISITNEPQMITKTNNVGYELTTSKLLKNIRKNKLKKLSLVLCFVFFVFVLCSDHVFKRENHQSTTTTTTAATTTTATTTKHLSVVVVSDVNKHPVKRRRGQRDPFDSGFVGFRLPDQRVDRPQQPAQQRQLARGGNSEAIL